MMGLLGGPCEGCRLRDETISQLRELLTQANKTSLAVLDARAYVLMYGVERAGRQEDRTSTSAPDTSPAEMRRRRFQPTLSPAEIEAQFAARRDEAQAAAGATPPPLEPGQ